MLNTSFKCNSREIKVANFLQSITMFCLVNSLCLILISPHALLLFSSTTIITIIKAAL